MEFSAEKTKLMTNSINGVNTNIYVRGQRLETVYNFKYLGSVITDEGSKPELMSRIAQTTAMLTKLKRIWKDKTLPFDPKLIRSLAMSIFIYACEMDSYKRTTKKSTSHGNELLSKHLFYLIQGPYNQRRGPQQNPTSHRAL